jgi:diguanylate cyclase (GGDEF)-like protein
MLTRWFPLARCLDRFGLAGTAAILVAASMALSALVTCAAMALWLGGVSPVGAALGALVPAVSAPPFIIALLRVVVQLRGTREELRRLSLTDELTGAFNRRHFLALAEKEFARARRYGQPFSVVMMDLDYFMDINDRYGHPGGDHVIRAVSELCRSGIRESDLFARLGGDEFVLLLPHTGRKRAVEIARRLQRLIAVTPVRWRGERLSVNASLGVATWSPSIRELDELLLAADHALFAAKRAGKDEVAVAPAPAEDDVLAGDALG